MAISPVSGMFRMPWGLGRGYDPGGWAERAGGVADRGAREMTNPALPAIVPPVSTAAAADGAAAERSGSFGRRPLSVSQYLVLLAFVVALPLAALGFFISNYVAEAERASTRAGLAATARALTGLVEREVERHIAL